MQRMMYARFPIFDRAWHLHNLVRLSEAANYSERMRRAGVPDKVRRKILRRWNPMPYAIHQEMKALVADMGKRF